ncbi:hypothetical protein BDW59DRAFT_148660 [Aspergillus cavernicola]|uniref:Uncharacterized protein n=1 Tax=Aspergillus cavernicola TaxID=176166 RepID=A0ABR4I6V3_9EURO
MRKENLGYSINNSVQRKNDTMFQSAVISLFKALTSWDKSHHLSLDLILRSRGG